MKTLALIICFLSTFAIARAEDFRHVGDYLLKTHYKIMGEEIVTIPIKTLVFHAFTDGITIRLYAGDQDDAYSSYQIYRSDGIGRQRSGTGGALEVIPGIQASSNNGGILRHLRLSQESFTITNFPGVSDQTIVSYAVAAAPKEADTVKN